VIFIFEKNEKQLVLEARSLPRARLRASQYFNCGRYETKLILGGDLDGLIEEKLQKIEARKTRERVYQRNYHRELRARNKTS
jgi:hypothetical protein